MSNRYEKYILFVFLVALFLILPHEVIARAGGGSFSEGYSGGFSGNSSGGFFGSFFNGIISLILFIFALIYFFIITFFAIKKNKQCNSLLQKLSEIDPAWDLNELKSRIEKTFFMVQQAWGERNQDIAKEYMSERLYSKHKIQTDAMLRNGTKNIMININLIEARIVEVMDFKDDSKDFFRVYIIGSMIDYTIKESTNEIIQGDTKSHYFKEIWLFKRILNSWVLDEIDQRTALSDMEQFQSFSETQKEESFVRFVQKVNNSANESPIPVPMSEKQNETQPIIVQSNKKIKQFPKRDIALAILLMDIALVDNNFDIKEHEWIKKILEGCFKLNSEKVISLIEIAKLETENSKDIDSYAQYLRLTLTPKERLEVYNIFEQLIKVDKIIDSFEKKLVQKYKNLLGV